MTYVYNIFQTFCMRRKHTTLNHYCDPAFSAFLLFYIFVIIMISINIVTSIIVTISPVIVIIMITNYHKHDNMFFYC